MKQKNGLSSPGALYDWKEMGQYAAYQPLEEQVQGVCPDGWHLPSDSEFMELEEYIGLPVAELDMIGIRGTTEGMYLKLDQPGIWKEPDAGSDNLYGFSAYPGGKRYPEGHFLQLTSHCTLWTSTMDSDTTAMVRIITSLNTQIERKPMNLLQGCSVRCVYNQ